MVEIEAREKFWSNRRVLITGHTGFVGSWLSLSLLRLGAEVIGYSDGIPTKPSLYEACQLDVQLEHISADIRNFDTLSDTLDRYKPQVIFHLAAQPLVKEAYQFPAATYGINVLGTVNLFEAIRLQKYEVTVVNMTSDKCYENTGKLYGYVEEDQLGGRDPYSSSKACSELLTRSYRESFFSKVADNQPNAKICSVRAGNIIGGGDWASNRLIPDCVKAFAGCTELLVRYPKAVRPWQHVLDVINAFVTLVEKADEHNSNYSQAWNIGPNQRKLWSVEEVVRFICQTWGGDVTWTVDRNYHALEERILTLDNGKAKKFLGWEPMWATEQALVETIDWYRKFKRSPDQALEITKDQIDRFFYETLGSETSI